MHSSEIEYADITRHIPHIIQTLYNEEILSSTSLVELRDAFRPNQMQSKAWLFNNLPQLNKSSRILIIGSWIGFTSYCFYKAGFSKITEVDLDKRLEAMTKLVNIENREFCHYTCDVNNLNRISQYDVIVNTSSEHILNNKWFDNIKVGATVIIQSTNLKMDDHPNTVDSVQELKSKYPLKHIHYADELVYNTTYSRYMLIGEK